MLLAAFCFLVNSINSISIVFFNFSGNVIFLKIYINFSLISGYTSAKNCIIALQNFLDITQTCCFSSTLSGSGKMRD